VISDLLVGIGILLIAVGVYLLLGLAAMLILVGILLIAGGIWWTVNHETRMD